MKKLFILSLFLLSTLSFASDEGKKGGQLTDEQKAEMHAKAKAEILAHMDKRIAALQEGKSCISAANDREQIKSCRKTLQSKMKGLQDEAKEARGNFKNRKQK